MTRQEQIEQAGFMRDYRCFPEIQDSFISGAIWADEHPAESPWISLSERQPEPKRRVLFLDKDGIAHLGYNNVGGETCTLYMNAEIEIPTVTHWMPIPPLK